MLTCRIRERKRQISLSVTKKQNDRFSQDFIFSHHDLLLYLTWLVVCNNSYCYISKWQCIVGSKNIPSPYPSITMKNYCFLNVSSVFRYLQTFGFHFLDCISLSCSSKVCCYCTEELCFWIARFILKRLM